MLVLGQFIEFAINCEGFAVPSKLLFKSPSNGREVAAYGCSVNGKGFEYGK